MSVREARRRLIASGHGATLSAAATARPGCWAGAGATEQLEHLAEIAAYIDDSDPMMIGAAFLLEQMGYERGREQLRLDLDASLDTDERCDPAASYKTHFVSAIENAIGESTAAQRQEEER